MSLCRYINGLFIHNFKLYKSERFLKNLFLKARFLRADVIIGRERRGNVKQLNQQTNQNYCSAETYLIRPNVSAEK